jgi:P-type Ca2+ transporter type 2C
MHPNGTIFSLRIPEVYQALETSELGLSTSEAESRLSLYGNNLLSDPEPISIWIKVFRQARHPLSILMGVAGIITLWQQEYALAAVIWLMTILNGAFSFWREQRAEKATEKLRLLLPLYAHIVRNSEEMHIPASDIVPGDLLVLAEGDNIPADARVVQEYGLRVNNASLTGEAIASLKTADASYQIGLSEVERPNLIFAGTTVASGTGRAVVYATGMSTQFGRIANLTQSVPDTQSPFQLELERISRIFMWGALILGGLVWVISTYDPDVRSHIKNPLILALGIIAAVTPEGLPATLTLSLAMAVQRLAAKGVMAKKLSIVETIGKISVICTDKSGTLTQNQMTVRDIWVAGRHIIVSGVGYEPVGEFSPPPVGQIYEDDMQILCEAALCCNNARLNPPSPEHPGWTSLGDQTEAALKVVALKFGLNEDANAMFYPRVHEIPFDARRKRMTTIHRNWNSEVAFVKGAPREILQLCTEVQMNGGHIPMNETIRGEILAATDEYARKALRVLAIAHRDLAQHDGGYSAEMVERELVFLGLVAMMDPPRPEVEKAIQICKGAGIRLVMITGDYGLTAESLARRVGMLSSPNPTLLTGSDLDSLSDAALQDILDKEIIFARMAPDHKLRLVSAFQSHGDVVAVTGDGVNDAPALRKADVGIAMGQVGTDVAKEAADIILTKDNFGAIVTAIEEGRAVYDNIRKFITYIFSSNVPEVIPFLGTAMFGIPYAINVHQILTIDMGTDIVPAIALGMEKPEPDVMKCPPRPRKQLLLDRGLLVRSFLWLGLIEALLCYIAFFAVYALSGNASSLNIQAILHINFPKVFNIDQGTIHQVAQTVFFAGAIIAQVGNAFACRTAKGHVYRLGWGTNGLLWFGILCELTILATLIYVQPLAKIFQQAVFPWQYWCVLLLNAPVLFSIEWIRKAVVRRLDRSRDNTSTSSVHIKGDNDI